MSNHEPTEERRKTCEMLAEHDIPVDEIARVLGIDEATLRLLYAEPLATGVTKARNLFEGDIFSLGALHATPPDVAQLSFAPADEQSRDTIADLLRATLVETEVELRNFIRAAHKGENSIDLRSRASKLGTLEAEARGLRAAIAFEIAVDCRRAINGERAGWLTPKEAAFETGYSSERIRQLVRAGEVNYVRDGGRILVELLSVQRRLRA